ncbi:bifunctional heptose 7-phosphate kinase/heptose 1-phosphate adenyltransferase [Bernardetia sp.]|uniref:bifunctional heptose 7-phosphate kinase/heptose 1-phosphate adenyltransferase n=1 Tax=Bernardetia sp. TaxID=1937974 RepID=UPI0025C541E8|nr:bifunctional ADP-heptose synthase [Bernardetia sp.]
MSLESIFENFSTLTALVIGDVMIDSYLWGKVERISPEAPVPVVGLNHRESRLGGAANVALNLKSLGAKTIMCSVVGNDKESETLISMFEEQGIDVRGIIHSQDRPTTIKHRILAGSQHLLRIDSETTKPISENESKTLIDNVKELINEVDVIIFEDYDKGVLNEKVISELIDIANENDIPTVIDPKKRNFWSYKNATLFKPNLKELREGLGREIDVRNVDLDKLEQSEIALAVEELKEKMQLQSVLITLSEYGVYIANSSERHKIAAHKREISDVSGAGDTVVSIAGLCMALKLPLKTVAQLANLGGGLVCESLGVIPINKNVFLQEAKKKVIL